MRSVLNVVGPDALSGVGAPYLPDNGVPRVLSPDTAFEIEFGGDPARALRHARAFNAGRGLDINVVPADNRRKKLLIADMDSTIIACECLDELADMAGLKPRIAAITERAMRGEIAFEPALRERVALLKGLPLDALARTLRERVQLNAGARAGGDDEGAWRAHAAGLRRLRLLHRACRPRRGLRRASGERAAA